MAYFTRASSRIIYVSVFLMLCLVCVILDVYTCVFNKSYCQWNMIGEEEMIGYKLQIYIRENATNDPPLLLHVNYTEDQVVDNVTRKISSSLTNEDEQLPMETDTTTSKYNHHGNMSHDIAANEDVSIADVSDEVSMSVNSTEMCKSVCPPFIWSEWTPCSQACGYGHRYRKAVYQFVCHDNHGLCLDHKLQVERCGIPCQFDPNKYGGKDGLPLYPTNPLNPPIYPEDRDYMCGQWIQDYAILHNAILQGDRPPSFMVYTTGRGTYPTPGGLADRIKGITTVFFLAVLLDRAFLIDWADPPGLTDYLTPNYFNWTISNTLAKSLQSSPVRDIGSWRVAKQNGISSQWHINTNFSSYFTNTIEILQGNRYDYTYALLRNPSLMPKAYYLGIDNINCRICCAFNFLFKTNLKFFKSMNSILSTFGSPLRPIITFYVTSKSNNIQEDLLVAKTYINCIRNASREMIHPIVIPVFQNVTFFWILAEKFPLEMKELNNPSVAALQTSHVTHLGDIPRSSMGTISHTTIQQRTFQDFFFMLNSSFLFRSKGYLSSFAIIADAIRQHRNPLGSVVTYVVTGSMCSRLPPNSRIE